MEVSTVFANLPTLETERLVLRKVTLEDIEDIHAYGSKEEVARYVTWDAHRDLAATKEFIDYAFGQYEKQDVAPWAIEHKETGKVIGTIDYITWQTKHRSAEIGYVLSPDYWGQGIMTEAAKAVIDFGFEKMDLVRIQARCFTENIGSARVMEKAGMSFEGIHRKSLFSKGKHWDVKVYAIVKE